MLDPLSSVGLASTITQFVGFSGKTLGNIISAYKAADGATEHNRRIERTCFEPTNLTADLARHVSNARQTLPQDEIASGESCDRLHVFRKKNVRNIDEPEIQWQRL